MEKEIKILSNITNKVNNFKENQNPEKNSDHRENIHKKESADIATSDLQTLLNIVNLMANNPGVLTIIFQELREKLKLDVSKQIFCQLDRINTNLSSKKSDHNLSPKKCSLSLEKRRLSAPIIKSKSCNSKNDTNDSVSNLSREIDNELLSFKENSSKFIDIEKLNDDGYYKLNNKKVILQLINGKLSVKMAGGFLPLKDFLEFQNFKKKK